MIQLTTVQSANGIDTNMTLNEFIKELQALAKQGHGDLPMYATHGASGASDPISNPFVREVSGDECGELCEFEIGTKYIDVYIGN